MTGTPPTFLSRVRRVVDRQPHTPAIEFFGGTTWTYGELWDRSNAIACRLRDEGVKREDVVAIAMPKSPEWVASVLGCWLARAAFLPVDDDLPAERRELMLAEGNPKILLRTTERSDDTSKPVCRVDRIEPSLSDAKSETADNSLDDLAYLIYTSGSTGKPKGIEITHAGIVPFLSAQIEAFRLGPESRALWVLSPMFDASISDVGTVLLSGGCLVIPPPNVLRDPRIFLACLANAAVTHCDLPPVLLRRIEPAELPETLNTIIIGGEVCPPATVREFASRIRVVNVYGPTEATVCTSLVVCDSEAWRRPLIGEPVPGIRYIVDDDSGELLIAGAGLARGYRARPDLTCEKFMHREGERVYRTGDRVRRVTGGGLEFVGRIDRQLKHHGRLIAPEEIEAACTRHADIEAALILRETSSLIGFAEVAADREVSSPELNDHLRRLLPGWMIPTRWVIAPRLPRTSTGKLDSAACLSMLHHGPDDERNSSQTNGRPGLVQHWRQVLNRDDAPEGLSFRDAGGDSIDLLDLLLLVRKTYPELPADALTIDQTLREMEQMLARPVHANAESSSSSPLRERLLADAGWQSIWNRANPGVRSTALSPGSVFITGATGFLGTHVLHRLLSDRAAGDPIVCLLRGDDEAEAFSRLQRNTRRYRLNVSEEDWKRVRIVLGDVGRVRFGLPSHAWQRLTEDVREIYHLAAEVNSARSCDQLWNANVDGVREACRLLTEGRPKRLQLASTLSVFVSTSPLPDVCREADDRASVEHVFGGYGRTKWIAEQAWSRLPTRLRIGNSFRLGLLVGSRSHGIGSTNDLLGMFVNELHALGCRPETVPEKTLDWTSIDVAAKLMTELSDVPQGTSRVVHIAGRERVSMRSLIAAVEQVRGPLRTITMSEFGQAVERSPRANLVLRRAFDLLPSRTSTAYPFASWDLFPATGTRFETMTIDSHLEDRRETFPEPNADWVRDVVRHSLTEVKS